MANTLLTVDQITREALRILHQKAVFISSINRAYDSSFANEGAKIGSILRIRLPNQYTVRTGAALDVQDTAEQNVSLDVSTQVGVDVNFSTAELTMDLDDFSRRILDPAMSVLAANIESTVLGLRNDVYNIVDNDAAALSLLNILQGRQQLNENLAPDDNQRTALLSNAHSATLVNALSGLFNDQGRIAEQYTEGEMGRAAGFMFMESSLADDHTTGTAEETTVYVTNDLTPQVGATLTVDGGTTTFLVGDIITIAGVNRVHPESKVDTGALQLFVITANSGASATSLALSPSIVATGARQNVTNGAADGQAIVKVGAGANELYSGSMVYHKDAFTFATADLLMPDGVDFASRSVVDGISMRVVRQYDINNDVMPTRIDVLHGQTTIRPELAVRIHADG